MENKDKKVYVDIDNSHGEMYTVLEQLAKDGIDPFDFENIKNDEENQILYTGKYWFVIKNRWPYKNSRVHSLLITFRYVESFEELRPEEKLEWFTLNEKFCKKNNIRGGALFMRYGDTRYTGATVKHLHSHLVAWDRRKSKGVTLPLGRTKKKK